MGIGKIILYIVLALTTIQLGIILRMMRFSGQDLKKGKAKNWQMATKINMVLVLIGIIAFAIRLSYFMATR